ncbi:hypothetical protein M0R04_07925 [Candidatus Dojkabacteria bacterium]|nr:hypothetical protein [Candidatus Dojkabacteria bacterium]
MTIYPRNYIMTGYRHILGQITLDDSAVNTPTVIYTVGTNNTTKLTLLRVNNIGGQTSTYNVYIVANGDSPSTSNLYQKETANENTVLE